MSACLLITKSEIEWHKTPITTTITTQALKNLPFPIVTVCPKKKSNTALNYDLMRLDNKTLTENQTQFLREAVRDAIFHQQQQHIKNQLDAVNSANLKSMFEGYQSVPKPYGVNGYEIRM